jgi:hypothetical protein
MSLLVRTSTDAGALLVRDTDDPLALSVTESTSALALRVRESTDPLAMRVRGLFSPTSLPGLAAWYDASDSSTVLTTVSPDVPASNGQTVRRWLDKSGNNRHLEQGNLTLQPSYASAGHLAFTSGLNTAMSASFSHAFPLTIFVVFRKTGNSDFDGVWSGSTANSKELQVHNTNNTTLFQKGAGGGSQTSASTFNVANFSIIGSRIVVGTGTNEIFNNGLVQGASNSGAYTDSILNIGARNSVGGSALTGEVKEFIMYAGGLSNPDMARVHQWLGRKHTITLLS